MKVETYRPVYQKGRRLGRVHQGADRRWYVGTADLAEHPSFRTEKAAIAYLIDRYGVTPA